MFVFSLVVVECQATLVVPSNRRRATNKFRRAALSLEGACNLACLLRNRRHDRTGEGAQLFWLSLESLAGA